EPLRGGRGGEGDDASRLVVLAVGYLMVEDALDPLDDRPADEEGSGPRREQPRSRRGREDVEGEERGRDVGTGRVADDAPEAALLQADAGDGIHGRPQVVEKEQARRRGRVAREDPRQEAGDKERGGDGGRPAASEAG